VNANLPLSVEYCVLSSEGRSSRSVVKICCSSWILLYLKIEEIWTAYFFYLGKSMDKMECLELDTAVCFTLALFFLMKK